MSLANFNYITQTNSQFQVNTTDTVIVPGYSWSTKTSTGLYGGGQDFLGFVINGTERLRIASNGNVGIGAGAITNSPGLFNVSASTNYTNTVLNQTGVGDALDVQINSSSKLIVKNTGTGLVGVGTNSPSVQLHSWSSLIGNIATTPFTPNMMGVLPIVILEEQLATPISITATPTTRQLNVTVADSISNLGTAVNLTGGTFTLASGLYYIQAEGTATTTSHRLNLVQTSGVTVNVWGTSESGSASVSTKSTINTILSLSGLATLRLQTSSSVSGTLGVNINIGGNNTFARITIIKLQ